jgi:hypothetical protein
MRLLPLFLLAVALSSCSYNDQQSDIEDWYAFSAVNEAGAPVVEGWVGYYRVLNDLVPPPDVAPDYEVGGVYGHWMLDQAGEGPLWTEEQRDGVVRGRIQMDDTLEVFFALPNPARSFTLIGREEGDTVRGRWELATYGEVEQRGRFTARLHRRARREAPGF